MSSTILESTPIYQLDHKQGFEGDWTPIELIPITQIIPNKPYLEFVYIESNNLINLRWRVKKML